MATLPGGFGGITLAYYVMLETEVDGIFSRVEALGGRVVKAPKLAPWNVYSGYFQDLDGYYWEAASCEQWRFDDNGMVLNIGEENL
jgi:predicted lactoylglutathione lyase